jgi:formylglycine-generating enzyme required for sulfatase activity
MNDKIKENSIGMKLALIEPGEFIMGAPESEPGRCADEGPPHRVILTTAFYIGVYPVTQREYENISEPNRSLFRAPDNPVEMVNIREVKAFCDALSEAEGAAYSLPTEAQWEYACRAGSKSAYSFGDDIERLQEFAWYADNSGDQVHPVGLKKPNAWGLHDMHGNVWEWCRDMWDPRGHLPVVLVDPVNTGFTNILKGGCYYNEPKDVRSAKRFGYYEKQRFYSVGFRVVREA